MGPIVNLSFSIQRCVIIGPLWLSFYLQYHFDTLAQDWSCANQPICLQMLYLLQVVVVVVVAEEPGVQPHHLKWTGTLLWCTTQTHSQVSRALIHCILKMLSYQYRKSHCADKTVVRSSYLYNGISYTFRHLFFIRCSPIIRQSILSKISQNRHPIAYPRLLFFFFK